MRVSFTSNGWRDYCSWTSEPRMLRRINRLIDEAVRDPGEGVGKPEMLRHDLAGHWSRRIDQEHRLVYAWSEAEVTIVGCRYHYGG